MTSVWIVLGHAGWGEDANVDRVFASKEDADAYYEGWAKAKAAYDKHPEYRCVWFLVRPEEYEVETARSGPR